MKVKDGDRATSQQKSGTRGVSDMHGTLKSLDDSDEGLSDQKFSNQGFEDGIRESNRGTKFRPSIS